MKILFLAANPQSTSRLNLEKEAREIQEALYLSELAREFELIQQWEVRPRDFRRALLRYEPDIVHFSGHGEGESGLVIVDELSGASKAVTGEALAGLFAKIPSVKCVLLNACYAEVQAQAIVSHVNYVIGMRETIYDKAAIAFVIGFYDGLGYGRGIEEAFDLGSNAILWEYKNNTGQTRAMIPVESVQVESAEKLPEHLKPVLLKKAKNVVEGINNQPQRREPLVANSKKKRQQQEAEELRRLQEEVERLRQQQEIENRSKVTEFVADSKPTNKDGIKLREFEFEVVTVNVQKKWLGLGTEVTLNRSHGQAQYFREDLGNGIGLDMVYIPGGEFMMGTEEEEIKRLNQKYNTYWYSSEKPRHEVKIQPFFIGKFQVTQAQWKAIASLPKVKVDLEPDPSRFKGDDLPVGTISWSEAEEFCQRLSKQTGKKYCLPTEAEWEYACRAGTTTPFHFGETITDELANYNANYTYANEPKGEYRQKTTSVGSFPPNAFGLYDMHGNVFEWCEDDWHNNYHDAPMDGSAWTSGDSSKKVLYGGTWGYNPAYCRSALRLNGTRDDRDDRLGFRVACVASRTT